MMEVDSEGNEIIKTKTSYSVKGGGFKGIVSTTVDSNGEVVNSVEGSVGRGKNKIFINASDEGGGTFEFGGEIGGSIEIGGWSFEGSTGASGTINF